MSNHRLPMSLHAPSTDRPCATLLQRLRPTALNLGLVLALLGTAGCGDDGPADCSNKFSEKPKLSEIQSQIFDRSCAFSNCHGDSGTQPKEQPLNLSKGKAATSLGSTAFGKPSHKRVEPGKADRSYIVEKLTAEMPTDGVRMPRGSDPLCQAEIDVIRKWIDLGASAD